MQPLFSVYCSSELAIALGAKPYKRLNYPHLSFPVCGPPRTHHACLDTKCGPYAWLWQMDKDHLSINR